MNPMPNRARNIKARLLALSNADMKKYGLTREMIQGMNIDESTKFIKNILGEK